MSTVRGGRSKFSTNHTEVPSEICFAVLSTQNGSRTVHGRIWGGIRYAAWWIRFYADICPSARRWDRKDCRGKLVRDGTQKRRFTRALLPLPPDNGSKREQVVFLGKQKKKKKCSILKGIDYQSRFHRLPEHFCDVRARMSYGGMPDRRIYRYVRSRKKHFFKLCLKLNF